MENNDFYFIYLAIGPPFIKTIIHNFSSIPKDSNVVVLTNTPKMLENVNVDFNLIVADIELLRDKWSKENEIIVYSENEDEYVKKFKELHDNNIRFPMQIMRFGIKWAYENNITKFAIIESGFTIGFDTDPNRALNMFRGWGENKNLMFANPYYNHKDVFPRYVIPYRDIVKKYGADLDNYPTTFETEVDLKFTGSITFEGGMFGLWFHDTSLVKMCFDLYSDIVKASTENGQIRCINGCFQYFEWISIILITVFGKYHNTMIVGICDLARHFAHPEEFYYMPEIVQSIKKDWDKTMTRDKFIEKNRHYLLEIFGDEERAKKLCYNFK